jgi:hypothetical protein
LQSNNPHPDNFLEEDCDSEIAPTRREDCDSEIAPTRQLNGSEQTQQIY